MEIGAGRVNTELYPQFFSRAQTLLNMLSGNNLRDPPRENLLNRISIGVHTSNSSMSTLFVV